MLPAIANYALAGSFSQAGMKKIENSFSYSVAEEIMPDLSYFKSQTRSTKFALILNTGETLSISDISDIAKRTELSPLLFDVGEFANSELLRSYARSLGAAVVKVQTDKKFAFAIRECGFSVSEDAEGAFLSFLSHTPTYINAGDSRCRALIGRISKLNFSPEVIIPYTKNRASVIERPQVTHEDFSIAIQKIRADVGTDFKRFLF